MYGFELDDDFILPNDPQIIYLFIGDSLLYIANGVEMTSLVKAVAAWKLEQGYKTREDLDITIHRQHITNSLKLSMMVCGLN